MPIPFDENYYINAKTQQLSNSGIKKSDGTAYTAEEVREHITSTGMKVEDHYNTYGRSERLNPNAYFNEIEYLESKLASLREDPKTAAMWAHRDVDSLRRAIADAGMTPAQHYEKHGAFETRADGTLLNPSNAFDANAYFAAKLQELRASGTLVDGKDPATLTVADVVKEIQKTGMSPISHYTEYGAGEAGDTGVPLVQTVPSEQRVPNDPARASVTKDIVPGNYNPPSLPPDQAVAAPVPKPADMGGKAPSAVSPPVVSPTSPLPVPGDTNYVKPPANLADTNDKPVVLVPTADGKLQLGVVDNATGNILGVDPNTGSVTDTVIGKDDGSGTIVPSPTPPSPGGNDPAPQPPVQDDPITKDLSAASGLQTIELSNADDTLNGVKPEHLTLKNPLLESARLDGKAGVDTINFTPGKYDIDEAQVASFEKVNIINTTQNFEWRMGATDYTFGDEVTIKAEALDGGNLRLNAKALLLKEWTYPLAPVKFTVSTGDNADNILWSPAQRENSDLLLNTGAGNDRVVLAAGSAPYGNEKIEDAKFGDITNCFLQNASNFFEGGAIDLGAGANTLVVYGGADFTKTSITATGGTIHGLEIQTINGAGVTVTLEQFKMFSQGSAGIIAGGEYKQYTDPEGGEYFHNPSAFNSLRLHQEDPAAAVTVDLSNITVREGACLTIDLNKLGKAVTLQGKATLEGTGNSKATIEYALAAGSTLTGISGQDETFSLDGLQGTVVSGNAGDNDKLVINANAGDVEEGTLLTVGDGGRGGTIRDISGLELTSSVKPDTLDEFEKTNIAFAQNSSIRSISGSLGDDTIDVSNLGVLGTVYLFQGGSDTLKGLTSDNFNTDTIILGSYTGSAKAEFAEGTYLLTKTNLCNVGNIIFTGESGDITLALEPYVGQVWQPSFTSVVDASQRTSGKLRFDASTCGGRFDVKGGANADTFIGSWLGDTFTGNGGADTFVYTNLKDSLLGDWELDTLRISLTDTITDFTTGDDKIQVSSGQFDVIKTQNQLSPIQVSSFEALSTALSASVLLAEEAAVVTIDSKNYLILNDADAGFDKENDAVICIGDATIAVGDFVSA